MIPTPVSTICQTASTKSDTVLVIPSLSIPSPHLESNSTNLRHIRSPARDIIRSLAQLRRASTSFLHTGVSITILPFALARIGYSTGIPVVHIDATQSRAINCSNAVDKNVSWSPVSSAIPASSDEFPVVIRIESGDGDRAAAVKLEDLVGCREGASSDHIGSTGSLLECCRVFADTRPPNVLECAVRVSVMKEVTKQQKLGTMFLDSEFLRLERLR